MSVSLSYILEKYGDSIAEEVNVKQVVPMQQKRMISKIYKPLGSKLSAAFGKDTANIIAAGKQGNVREQADGSIVVFSDAGEWKLTSDMYEVVYEGLTDDTMAVDGNVLILLDTHITPELAQEGLARELSRFINQMRKDADFRVDARVKMLYKTQTVELIAMFEKFSWFLQDEALLSSLDMHTSPSGDIQSSFVYEDMTCDIALKQ